MEGIKKNSEKIFAQGVFLRFSVLPYYTTTPSKIYLNFYRDPTSPKRDPSQKPTPSPKRKTPHF
jgi:hypothetical protein